jgi:hypothetical protein
MKPDVQVQELGEVACLACGFHGVGHFKKLPPKCLRGVEGRQLCSNRLNCRTELRERAELRSAGIPGQTPPDHEGIKRIPAVGRKNPDAYSLDCFDQAEGLQDADGFADHRAGYFEFILQLLGQDNMACGKTSSDDAGTQMFDGTMVEAG